MVILRDSPVSAEGAESDIFGVDGIPKIQHVDPPLFQILSIYANIYRISDD